MWRELTAHLSVFQDAGNVGVLRDGDRVLLIDIGHGAVLPALGDARVDALLFTHHHRDVACGAHALVAAGAATYVPTEERTWFEAPETFWHDPQYRYHLYNVHPHHQMLAEGFRVDHALADGEVFTWGPARITALHTPGHTDGSMSYLVEVDGRTVAFTGDLIYAPGQVWELYSLQKGNDIVCDYHGFLGTRDAVVASLRRVLESGAQVLAPTHGAVMHDPAGAVEALAAQLAVCYDDYAAISALRWYFPQMFPTYLTGEGVMPIGPGQAPPPFVRNHFTSWTLISESGAAFVMDCGNPSVVEDLRRWQAAGEITTVEGLWITHYHDDHTEALGAFLDAFGAPIHADPAVAQVLAYPEDWRLPCNTPNAVPIAHWTQQGERWQWREFTFTAYHFPGQTLYHGALLVEGRGMRLFFIGDSFTPAGIDDYCAHNRNFLGAGVGFDGCLALVEALQPDLLFNPHVAVAFSFTPEEIRYMRANLAWRETSFGALLPWPHPNFGMDDGWARCHPYEQKATPGATRCITVAVTNHAPDDTPVAARAALPRAWGGGYTAVASCTVPGKGEGRLVLSLPVPAEAAPGRYVLPVDLTFGDRELPQIAEAVIEIVAE